MYSEMIDTLHLGCVWIQSFRALVRAGGTHGLTQLYRGAWDNDYYTRVPFFFNRKKKMIDTLHPIIF